MAKVKITGHASGSGILTVTAPNTSSDRTITLPDATGTLATTGINSFTGDTTITSGDLIFATAAKGICLGVTSNTDANTLDDYEEGTWTPAITSTGGTYTAQNGSYTKIGRMVHLFCFVTGNTFTYSASTDVFTITGVPFAEAGQGYIGQPGSFYGKLHFNNSGSSSTTASIVTTVVSATSIQFSIMESQDAGGGNNRIKVDNNAAYIVQVGAVYWTTA